MIHFSQQTYSYVVTISPFAADIWARFLFPPPPTSAFPSCAARVQTNVTDSSFRRQVQYLPGEISGSFGGGLIGEV
jgi:hypothetical protein